MAPTATSANGHNATVTNGTTKTTHATATALDGEVHLTSADVIQLEHEYGAHKCVRHDLMFVVA